MSKHSNLIASGCVVTVWGGGGVGGRAGGVGVCVTLRLLTGGHYDGVS
jgi:hypothetical protein